MRLSPSRSSSKRLAQKERLSNLLPDRTIIQKAQLSFQHHREVQNMAKCDICGKGVTFGIKVSHSHRRSNRTWKPNVVKVKAIVNGSPKRVNVCTRCLRSGKVTRAV